MQAFGLKQRSAPADPRGWSLASITFEERAEKDMAERKKVGVGRLPASCLPAAATPSTPSTARGSSTAAAGGGAGETGGRPRGRGGRADGMGE